MVYEGAIDFSNQSGLNPKLFKLKNIFMKDGDSPHHLNQKRPL
jgi:hypothetical protein